MLQEHTPAITNQVTTRDGPLELDAVVTEKDMKVTVEKGLVTEAEEEDMEALLGTYEIFSLVFYKGFGNMFFRVTIAFLNHM